MKAKWLAALLLGTLGTTSWGQNPSPPTVQSIVTATPNLPPLGPVPTPNADANLLPPGPSAYVIGDKEKCCNVWGVDPEIGTELYFRPGISLPFGGQRLGRNLSTGYIFQLGAHTLFYDMPHTSAWVVDTSVSTFHNGGVPIADRNVFLLDINLPNAAAGGAVQFFNDVPATIHSADRTFFNLGVGRDWWLWGEANCPGGNFRVGADGGARYGWMTTGINELRHRGDVVGGLYLGGHALSEIPWGDKGIFQVGFRTEYSYTWSDIMQTQSDIQEFNLYLTFGLRY